MYMYVCLHVVPWRVDKKCKTFLSFLTEESILEKAIDSCASHGSGPVPWPNGGKPISARAALEKSKSVSPEQGKPASGTPQGHDFEYTAKIRTLAETERFFDELTKEKDQVKETEIFRSFWTSACA